MSDINYIYSLQIGAIMPLDENGQIGLPAGFRDYDEWRRAELAKCGYPDNSRERAKNGEL